jgi:hypothetical protein
MRRGRVPAPVPAPLQPQLARPRRSRGRPDGTQRLDHPADAGPLRCQRPQHPRLPHPRPHPDRHMKMPARHPCCPGLHQGTLIPASLDAILLEKPHGPGRHSWFNDPAGTWSAGDSGHAVPRSSEDGTPGSPGLQLRADPASLAARLPCESWSPQPLNTRLRKPPKAFGGPHRNPTSPPPGPPPRDPHGHDDIPRHTPALMLK